MSRRVARFGALSLYSIPFSEKFYCPGLPSTNRAIVTALGILRRIYLGYTSYFQSQDLISGATFTSQKMNPRIRKAESLWERAFWANYILVLHAIVASVIPLIMLRVIDGITVGYNNNEPWFRRSRLQADDITTAVSTAILVIRILTGAWATRSAWRCALILLETQGVTLFQFNRMVSWPAYFLIGSTDAIMATLILLLLVPANLVTPVLTGAVGWRNVVGGVVATPVQHAGPAAMDGGFYWYSLGGAGTRSLALSAAGRAGASWLEFGKNITRSSRLVALSRQRIMPINSTVDNVTLPFLEVHSISWDKKSDFQKNITDELDFDMTAKSNLTRTGDRPFNYYHPGNAVLFDRNFLEDSPSVNRDDSNRLAALPSPTVFHGTKKVALLVTRQNTNNCTTLGETVFGNKTSMANLKDLYRYGNPYHENCFLIGTVNFTAGVITKRATYIAPSVIEARLDPSTSIKGDNWVIESLYLMPDVMTGVSMFNMSQFPTWDNLDGYVGDLIRVSYQAAWGQLAFQFNTLPLDLIAHEPVYELQAVVSLPRVIGWYSAQFLVLVSAALLWMLQRRSSRPITIDTGVVALMVDAAPVLNKCDEEEELSRMSYVTEHDGGGAVRLAECDVPSSGEQGLRHRRHDSKSSETVPLVEQDESDTEPAKPKRRFMLVPPASDGKSGRRK